MKRLVAAAVAGTLSSSLLASPAVAKPGMFELVKTFRLAGDETVTSVIAPSRTSAFVFGARDHLDALKPVAFRWNGKRWRNSPLPAGVRGLPGQAAASSARNVWVTVPGNDRLLTRYTKTRPDETCTLPENARRVLPRRASARGSKVLRWNGRRWTVARTFKNAYVNEVVAFGPRNVRVYGLDRKGPASWHFNGRTWRRAALPFLVTKAEAVSAREIWALARDRSSPGTFLVRFDGTRWTRVRPDAPSLAPARPALLLDLNVLGRDRLWLSARTTEGDPCSPEGETAETQLHWNGRIWTAESPRTVQGFLLSGHASDGAGGLYAHAWGSDSGDEWDFDRALFHRSAKGVWSRRILSEKNNVQHLARIPGTRSLWAAGTRETADGLNVAVWSLRTP